MITRNAKGKLIFSNLNFEILLDEIVSMCKTEDELDWVELQLQMCIEKQFEEFKENV